VPSKEGRSTRQQQVQPWIAAAIDLVDELPNRIEALLAGVRAHALDGFHLVEHENEALAPGLAEKLQEPAQEPSGRENDRDPLEPSLSLHVRCYVWLPHQPGEEPFGHRHFAGESRAMHTTKSRGKLRLGRADQIESSLQQLADLFADALGIVAGKRDAQGPLPPAHRTSGR